MLIECRQRRKARSDRVGRKDIDAGSKSKVFGRRYHFRPQAELVNGIGDPLAHICEVEDPRAIERFLSIAEAYNEFGKPPRVRPEGSERAAGGQPEIITELLDAKDTLGHRDSKPYTADPLEHARRLQAEWVQDTLDKSVHDIVKAIPGLHQDEIGLLLDGEKIGQQRSELLTALDEPVEESGEIQELQME